MAFSKYLLNVSKNHFIKLCWAQFYRCSCHKIFDLPFYELNLHYDIMKLFSDTFSYDSRKGMSAVYNGV